MKKILKRSLLSAGMASFVVLCLLFHVNAQKGANCFASDPGMGSTNRNDHYNWAQGQDGTTLEANIQSKMRLLYNCTEVNDNAFASAFADISVIIAQFVPKAICFNNDPGAINTNRSSHYNWAKNKSRFQIFENLHLKMTAAFRCLDNREQKIFFAAVSVLIAQTSANSVNTKNPGGNNNTPGDWKVWVKTSPCSGRFDWITVAKENPTAGGKFYYLADHIISGTGCTVTGCTFESATQVAKVIRSSSQFFNYCCRDYSVWKNYQTGKMRIVAGKFGTGGLGWSIVKGDLCCEEAETLAGIPGACSGTNDPTTIKCGPGSYSARNPQTQKVECFCQPGLVWNKARTACIEAGTDEPPTVKCGPGSYVAINTHTNRTECYCKPGLVWNSTKTACVDPQELVRNADCSGYPGSYPAWNKETQKVECFCPTGKKWNNTKTACVDDIANVNCYPGSHAEVNPQTNRTECYCNPGLVWNSTQTACVDPQELVRNTDCSAYPGSYAAWNAEKQKVECFCPTGKKWNSTMTACIDITDNRNTTNTADISGKWSGLNWIYEFSQTGKTFSWRITNDPVYNETAQGELLDGNKIKANWTNKNGTDSGMGIVIVENGRVIEIRWNNGISFTRQN